MKSRYELCNVRTFLKKSRLLLYQVLEDKALIDAKVKISL